MSDQPVNDQPDNPPQDDDEFDEGAALAQVFVLNALLRKAQEKKQAQQQEGNANG